VVSTYPVILIGRPMAGDLIENTVDLLSYVSDPGCPMSQRIDDGESMPFMS